MPDGRCLGLTSPETEARVKQLLMMALSSMTESRLEELGMRLPKMLQLMTHCDEQSDEGDL
jgi:hypothetical protein